MQVGTDGRAAPLVIAVGGKVASGKSHVARALATRLDAVHVEADRVRDELQQAAASPLETSRRALGLGELFAREVYAELRRRAERALAAGRSLVVDACLPRIEQREAIRSLARRHGAPFLFVECRPDPQVVARRLLERDASESEPGWPEIAEALAREWQAPDELPEAERQVVDSGGPLERTLAAVEQRLRARGLPAEERSAADGPWSAVTFDCWNTLIYEPSWPRAHARRIAALVAAAGEAGREVGEREAGTAFDAAWERHMRLWGEGVASGAREVAIWALAELGLREPHPALEHLTRQFEEASHSGEVTALPGAGETLEALAHAGVRRGLVCDTGLTSGRVVRLHLARLGLLGLLEVTVFSDEVGVPKPDPRAFQAALAPLAVAPRHALHVGDLRRTDVAGARGLGMATARILARHDDASDLPEADHVVRDHAELRSLLASRAAPA